VKTMDARSYTIGSPYTVPLAGKFGRAMIGAILHTLTLVLLPVLADATWGGSCGSREALGGGTGGYP